MDFGDDKLVICNNADYDVCILFDENSKEELENSIFSVPMIPAHASRGIEVVNNKWDWIMESLDTLTFYFVSKDSLDKYDYAELYDKVKPLKKVTVTDAQIDSLNWTLEFP